MTTPDNRNWHFEYNPEIASGGAPVYCRAEGSNEYLQMVFRKESDIPEAERANWNGPVPIGTVVQAYFNITVT